MALASSEGLLDERGFRIAPPVVHCGEGRVLLLDQLIGASAHDELLTLHAAVQPDGRGCCRGAVAGKRRLQSVHVRFDSASAAERAAHDVCRAATIPAPGSRRLLVLINPLSGERQGEATWEEVRPFFEASGAQLEVVTTSRAGEAQERAAELDPSSVDAIVCVSGDGLFHEVVNGLMSRPDSAAVVAAVSVAAIPAGSGNSLACSILKAAGEPLHAVSSAFLICRGGTSKLDTWHVEQEGQGGKSGYAFLSFEWAMVRPFPVVNNRRRRHFTFVHATLIAFPSLIPFSPCPEQASDVDVGSDEWRCLGPLRFDLYSLWRLLTRRRYTGGLRFRRQGSQQWTDVNGDFVLLWALNMPWLDAGTQFAPRAHFDDGCIDLVIIQSASRAALLSAFLTKMEVGGHVDEEWCQYEKVVEFELDPNPRTERNPGLVAVDGELWPFAKTKCKVLPIRLNVLGVGSQRSDATTHK